MEQMFPLSYLVSISLHRYMIKAQLVVAIGRISIRVAFPVGDSREILELLSGSRKQKFLTGKTPKQAVTFISWFMEVKGEFSQSNFQGPGWVYSTTILVGEDGLLHPQGIGRITAPVRVISCRQGCVLRNHSESI